MYSDDNFSEPEKKKKWNLYRLNNLFTQNKCNTSDRSTEQTLKWFINRFNVFNNYSPKCR